MSKVSKYQAMKSAIEEFQPGGGNAPILYSTTEMNDKAFKSLAGRKLKTWSIHTVVLIAACVIFLVAISLADVFFGGNLGARPAPAVFVPFIVIFMFRTTLITVTDNGFEFYFLESKWASYVVYDKMSLPYDKITNVTVKTRKFNTYFTFEIPNAIEGKRNYKIKTTVPNKMRKMDEQAENLKLMLAKVEEIS